MISQVHQVSQNYPSSIPFSQLWNSSQLARLLKVNVALSPDLNTACWFAKIDLSASVQKQKGCLSASAVKLKNSGFVESGQYRLFSQNMFRVQIALYVENNALQSARFFKVAFIIFLHMNSSYIFYESLHFYLTELLSCIPFVSITKSV